MEAMSGGAQFAAGHGLYAGAGQACWRVCMNVKRWMLVVLAGGLLLSAGSCLSDLGYYAIDALADYLPDLLESLGTTSTTT